MTIIEVTGNNNQPRRLEEICDEVNFSINLLGNTYCSLKVIGKTGCKFQKNEQEENGMFPCIHPKYNKDDYPDSMIVI